MNWRGFPVWRRQEEREGGQCSGTNGLKQDNNQTCLTDLSNNHASGNCSLVVEQLEHASPALYSFLRPLIWKILGVGGMTMYRRPQESPSQSKPPRCIWLIHQLFMICDNGCLGIVLFTNKQDCNIFYFHNEYDDDSDIRVWDQPVESLAVVLGVSPIGQAGWTKGGWLPSFTTLSSSLLVQVHFTQRRVDDCPTKLSSQHNVHEYIVQEEECMGPLTKPEWLDSWSSNLIKQIPWCGYLIHPLGRIDHFNFANERIPFCFF